MPKKVSRRRIHRQNSDKPSFFSSLLGGMVGGFGAGIGIEGARAMINNLSEDDKNVKECDIIKKNLLDCLDINEDSNKCEPILNDFKICMNENSNKK